VRNLPTESKQNALELSRLIVQDTGSLFKNEVAAPAEIGFKFAFYPCSSIRKDDLGIELTKHNLSFEEVTAYRTTHSEVGLQELRETLNECLINNSASVLNFLVFFSPSACEAVFEDASLSELVRANLTKVNFLSIGPSTSAKLNIYLPGLFNKSVFEIDEPSPQALLAKLNSF
jgi:uroporphyrinogen-III synthase